jgi:hypothetical protein
MAQGQPGRVPGWHLLASPVRERGRRADMTWVELDAEREIMVHRRGNKWASDGGHMSGAVLVDVCRPGLHED